MVSPDQRSGEGERRRRGAGPAIAISLAIHAALLLAVGLIVPKSRYMGVEPPPVTVQLLPSLERPQSVRSRTGASAAAAGAAAGRTAAPILLPHVHTPRTVAPNAPPSPVAAAPPAPAGLAPGPPGVSTAPGPLPYNATERGGVTAFLRGTVGCESADALHLTSEERARCAERFAQDARRSEEFSGIDPAKRGAFAAQAAADEHKRFMRDNQANAPLFVPCTGAGSNFGVGCLPDTAVGHVRTP